MLKNIFIVLLLLGGVCSLVVAQNLDTSKLGNNTAAGKYLKLSGMSMYYEIYGKGEPLLLVHGGGQTIENWINQVSFFEQRYQVIVMDCRSNGKSADIQDSISYEMMADDLNYLLDHLGLKQVNVLGWSDGAITGLLLAIRHPEKVKKLVVTGANLKPDSTAVSPFLLNAAFTTIDSLKKQKQTPQVRATLKHLKLITTQPNISAVQLQTIKSPTLVLGGDHDIVLPEHTLSIAQSIPNSYTWIIPNSGHAIPIVKKDLFNATVLDFFAEPFRKFEGMDILN